MKEIYTLKTLLYLGFFSLLFSCKKNDNPIEWKDPVFTQGNLVTASFTGRITDNDNYPLSGATVTAGGKTTTTDVNGQFNIANASVSSNAALIKVTKNGFFTGYRTLIVTAGASYRVQLVLIAKGTSQAFPAASGGAVNMGNGCNIQFPANGVVVQSSGAAYNGAVTVSAFFLNPADSNFNSYMPGDLRGVNSDNNEQLLQSYGMVVVELQGNSGEKLQLASGKKANITLPIAAALQASAPDSIPLWHFDEAIGIWKEEGKAAKQGNAYIGTVSHFSFWNCDVAFRLVRYTATFKDQQGNPLVNAFVSFKRPNGDIRSGYTNGSGFLNAYIPYDEPLVMTVREQMSIGCLGLLLTQNVGPYQADVNAGSISVGGLNSAAWVNVTGTVIGCNGVPVATGFVLATADGQMSRAAIQGGVFSYQQQICLNTTTTVSLFAYDSTTGFTSPTKDVAITSPNPFNAGQLTINCPSVLGGFLNMTIDSTQIAWVASASDSLYAVRYYEPSIFGFGTRVTYQAVPMLPNRPNLSFTFNGSSTGTNLLNFFQYFPNGSSNPTNVYNLDNPTTTIAPIIITEYGPVGGYIRGSFNTFLQRNGISVPIQCSFRVRRVS
jgi:hypothetical protein